MYPMNRHESQNRQCDSEALNFSRPGPIRSDELFGRRNEVQILHEGEVYRLRLTKNGKLILNK